ncbi:MAG: GNAT family N-acetyltransferase [Hyphomicrobiaceae bacterium]
MLAEPIAPSIVTTRRVTAADMADILALGARVYGPGRFSRTAFRVREGTPDISPFCRLAELDGRVIASIRMTEVTIGDAEGVLLLGPLTVDPRFENKGYGRRLMIESMDAGRQAGHRLVVLVGDLAYYARVGFGVVPPGQILLPGPVNPARLLACELCPGALTAYRGMMAASPAA